MKTILYPLIFWLSDCQLYDEECHQASTEGSAPKFPRLFQRFLKAIPDSDAAHYRCVRMWYAMSFFHKNMDAIESARGAVCGEEQIMIKPEFIVTLHKFFAGIPDRELENPVSVEDFIRELKEAIKIKEFHARRHFRCHQRV